MDQQRSQVGIPSLAHAQQVGLAARGMLSWHKAKPCGDLTTIVEVLRIADRRDQRAGRDRPDTRDLGQLAAEVIAAVPCLDLHFEFFDLAVQFLEVIEKPLYKNPNSPGSSLAPSSINSGTRVAM